jgi:glucose dehydrogenase
VFLPTSSPSPDFWGGKRPGNNDHANSVVALRAETGQLVWSFQTVHHDVWDYDLPAQPTLARIDTGDGQRDVVIQPTKQGFVFVLDRDTGKPVWPVEERSVPQNGAEGEQCESGGLRDDGNAYRVIGVTESVRQGRHASTPCIGACRCRNRKGSSGQG